jgi:hypothetical protein
MGIVQKKLFLPLNSHRLDSGWAFYQLLWNIFL